MINYEYLDWKYFLFSNNNFSKFWPFDKIWVKWQFFPDEFSFEKNNLKTWKNSVWQKNWLNYFFQEEKDILNFTKYN